MDKKKLLKEHKHLKVSLINKIKFIYSKEFYKLSEEEQKQYMINKSSTEGNLATLSNLLYSDKASIDATNNLMLYWFLSGMFNPQSSFGSSTNNVDKLKEQIDKDEQESK